MKLIERWKESVIQAKAQGRPDIECAQVGRVSMEKMYNELRRDAEFRERFEKAKLTGPRRVFW